MAIFLLLLLSFFSTELNARQVKPLYKLPEQVVVKNEKFSESRFFLSASSKGLFRVTNNNTAIPLWTDGAVEQIVRTEIVNEDFKNKEVWYFRTSKGILYTSDLENFELRNTGLPFLTIKKYDGVNTTFEKQVHTLKDLCVNPLNPNQIVTATKDAVYLSRDGGLNWKSLKSMSLSTSGIKAVAIASMPVMGSEGVVVDTELVVFMSHPIFGLSYIKPDSEKPRWIDVTSGFEMMQSLTSPDEIADIYPVIQKSDDGSYFIEIYISQTYIPRIYRFDWEKRAGICIYKGTEPVETIDGLTNIDNVLIYTKNESIGSLNIDTLESPGTPEKLIAWKETLSCVPGAINAAWIPFNKTGFKKGLCLNELWLLYPGTINTPYAEKANGKKSLYVSAYQCRKQDGIDKFKKIIKDNKLNSLVIDMKDDYGLLRYDTKDPLVMQKGKVSQYAVNLDHFVSEFKKDDVYLIARIVVFKDRNLSKYDKSKYAVWNNRTNSPWMGIRSYKEVLNEETGEVIEKVPDFYDENWVDPYSPEVWEYNIAISKELIKRGFDEIQFDYIRFPTDGLNLRQANYRWRSEGMDKESALVSFLSYARENIDAPIGIDIYGANGWYRSGTRTGQDVEMMADYVDVIGPMFYPSHFEQSFLNYDPFEDRTYRIYFYGTYRNAIMARNRCVIRPWVQAFYLNVSYDRMYYNKDYVQKQIFGVRDSTDTGYMYWNNSGKYDYISEDIQKDTPFTGSAFESSLDFRKPAIGTELAPENNNDGISVLDNVYKNGKIHTRKDTMFVPFLKIK